MSFRGCHEEEARGFSTAHQVGAAEVESMGCSHIDAIDVDQGLLFVRRHAQRGGQLSRFSVKPGRAWRARAVRQLIAEAFARQRQQVRAGIEHHLDAGAGSVSHDRPRAGPPQYLAACRAITVCRGRPRRRRRRRTAGQSADVDEQRPIIAIGLGPSARSFGELGASCLRASARSSIACATG